MKRILIISGLTLLLTVVPATAQRGMRGGGMGRGGGTDGCGSGMGSMRGGMGGMSGGMWDRMDGNRGGWGRDGMSERSRGEMGRRDSGRMNGPTKDGMPNRREADMNRRSSREPGYWDRRQSDTHRSESGMDDMTGPSGFGGSDVVPDRPNSGGETAMPPREPQLERNREQLQARPDQQGHERHQ